MKKTLFFGLIAAALGFTACSSEDDGVLGDKTQKKGMVLNATVEQPAESRAYIDNTVANWRFSFAKNDEIKVTNSTLSDTYYTFKNDGTNFNSTDATPTATAANWFAYFPSNNIDLTNQVGNRVSYANLYAMAGATKSATTGGGGLTIPMSAKVAILKIENYKGAIDIQVKTSATDYVTGLTAKSGEAGFDVTTSTTAASLFKTTTTGDHYIVVPAGVKLTVKDGANTLKSTGESGLTAGKYYILTIGQPLTLTATENSKVKIEFTEFQYKKSGDQSWTDYTSNTYISVNSGEYIQFRRKPISTYNYVQKKFVMTGSFDASGNVMSLVYGREMGDKAFYSLFSDCLSLKNASELQLPATELTESCYDAMFRNCKNLTTAPKLNAKKLAAKCYEYMFYGCESLTAAPELNVKTLASRCYEAMFYGCKSLTTAPTLPATTLVEFCYYRIFYDCTKLSEIRVYFTSWPNGKFETYYWIYNAGSSVTGTKNFYCPNSLRAESYNYTRFPSGWTKVAID